MAIAAKEVPGLINEAVEQASGLVRQRKYASAYKALYSVAKMIATDGENRNLRIYFSLGGGSWAQMGAGAALWKLPEDVRAAHKKLVSEVNSIPETGLLGTYKDEE